MSRRNSGYFVSHPVKIMADVSRNPREHWLKPLFSKNEVAKSGYTLISHNPTTRTPPLGTLEARSSAHNRHERNYNCFCDFAPPFY